MVVPWAAPTQLEGLLPRSVDHTSVWWHPLTAFSITMALSHLCPSSLSQLNELFPRQIKTGDTIFTRSRRLGKGIQMGVMGAYWERCGDRATLSTAMGDKGKGKAWYRWERCREHEGTWNHIYSLFRGLQEGREATEQGQIFEVRDMQEVTGGQERTKLTGRWPWHLCQLSSHKLQNAQVFSKTSRHACLIQKLLIKSLCFLSLWEKQAKKDHHPGGTHTVLSRWQAKVQFHSISVLLCQV